MGGEVVESLEQRELLLYTRNVYRIYWTGRKKKAKTNVWSCGEESDAADE